MNDSDEVWMWVYRKYVMSQIMQRFHPILKKLTLLLPTMFDWFEKWMNESDEVWRWAHQKYVMIQIIQKFHSIKKVNFSCCYRQCLNELTKQWMIVMKYEGECIENIQQVESYKHYIQYF